MSPRVVASPAALESLLGVELAGEQWTVIDQTRIDGFAEVTEDQQWIHVDPVRAASGRFGGTIAHGYLVLSLLPRLRSDLLDVRGVAIAINYGFEKVRFLTPVRSGARVRARARVDTVEVGASGVRVGTTVTVEIEGEDRPALVAETVVLYVPA